MYYWVLLNLALTCRSRLTNLAQRAEMADMDQVIKQLLTLQDRDRKILGVEAELSGMVQQRQVLNDKVAVNQAQLETVKNQFKQLESARKQLELEADGFQQQIQKYSLQQYQTKKNDEYRALAHEIETCKASIRQREDRQLDLMEQAEAIHKQVLASTAAHNEIGKVVSAQLSDLRAREEKLVAELASLKASRHKLTEGLDEGYCSRYERLLKHKGEKVLVGVDRGACGGCHIMLPPQTIILCKTKAEMVTCINCGRMLYYSPEMDPAAGADD